jgi:hypothetical protein
MRLKLLLLFCFSVAVAAPGQSDFHVYAGTENLIEDGPVAKLTVVSGNLQFNLRPPKDWSSRADEAGHKIVFTDESGRSALTVQFTTNSPGTLPSKDVLQAQAQRAHPGFNIVASGVCPTSYQPGLYFDLVRVAGPGLVQRTRHAFVTQPAGQVEFVLVGTDDEFGLGKPAITGMLSAFRAAPLKPKQP